MAATTFDRLTERWLAQSRNRGLPLAKVAQALGLSTSELWARVWRGEIQATELALMGVVEPEALAKLGLL